MNLSRKLIEICKNKKISLARLSKMSGVPMQTIHGWTLGKRALNMEQVRKVANVLEIPFYNLIFGEDDPHLSEKNLLLKEIFNGDVRVTIHKILRK